MWKQKQISTQEWPLDFTKECQSICPRTMPKLPFLIYSLLIYFSVDLKVFILLSHHDLKRRVNLLNIESWMFSVSPTETFCVFCDGRLFLEAHSPCDLMLYLLFCHQVCIIFVSLLNVEPVDPNSCHQKLAGKICEWRWPRLGIPLCDWLLCKKLLNLTQSS